MQCGFAFSYLTPTETVVNIFLVRVIEASRAHTVELDLVQHRLSAGPRHARHMFESMTNAVLLLMGRRTRHHVEWHALEQYGWLVRVVRTRTDKSSGIDVTSCIHEVHGRTAYEATHTLLDTLWGGPWTRCGVDREGW